nr:MAG TPA: hypothetical protein [Caudoviricetes sp.]
MDRASTSETPGIFVNRHTSQIFRRNFVYFND